MPIIYPFQHPTPDDWEALKIQSKLERQYAKFKLAQRYNANYPMPPDEPFKQIKRPKPKPEDGRVERRMAKWTQEGEKMWIKAPATRNLPSAKIPLNLELETDRVCKYCGTKKACECWKNQAITTGQRYAKGSDPTDFSAINTGSAGNRNQQRAWNQPPVAEGKRPDWMPKQ